jgi:peptide subunit release factor 1 (eRF1)
VQELFDAAGAGGAGVIGLDGTVAALLEGRVRTLLVADGAAADGAVCPQCDYFAARPFDRCPLCGNEAETPTDVVEVAVERAVLSGADVESLLGEARDTLRGRGHEVGALLRY